MTFGLENEGGFNGLCQESPSLPSLSSCISAQAEGDRKICGWPPWVFFFEINDFFLGVFKFIHCSFLFICLCVFSPLPKNEGVLLLLRRLKKYILYNYIYSF